MDLGIVGKSAVVCGASKGMGLGVAAHLAREGAKVSMIARNSAELEKAVSTLRAEGLIVHGIAADLIQKDEVQRAISEARNKFGDPEIAVTMNYGHFIAREGQHIPRGIENTTDEELKEASESLVMDIINVVREVLPAMKKKQWGRIVHFGSVAMKEPHRDPIYLGNMRVAACAVIKNLSNELGEYGITVNGIAPGPIDTPTFHSYIEGLPESMNTAEKWAKNLVPMDRLGTKEDAGALAAFLASEMAGWITGQTVFLDGGYTRSLL